MRKIVLLAAASIMVAATLPVSAKSTMGMLQTCEAVGMRAYENMKKVCQNQDMSAFDLRYTTNNMTELKTLLIELLNNYPADSPLSKDCLYAMLKLWHTCDIKPRNIKRKYTEPTSTKRSVPPAGLLETTPGLSPQGPATVGTPSRPR
jgi:hypothetical protein